MIEFCIFTITSLSVFEYEKNICFRTCWSISCVGAASIDILQPDPALHLAVQAYNTSGDIDLECLKVVRRGIVLVVAQ